MNREIIHEENYKHSLPIQIRFSDIDALNHVNNSIICQYYDLGRINYFEDIFEQRVDWSNILVVIVNLSINFFAQIQKDDNIFVETKIVSFGNKSMKMSQRIIDKTTNIIKSDATTILSGFDKTTNTSIIIPEDLKKVFLDFEAL